MGLAIAAPPRLGWWSGRESALVLPGQSRLQSRSLRLMSPLMFRCKIDNPHFSYFLKGISSCHAGCLYCKEGWRRITFRRQFAFHEKRHV